ncbi:MAG: hypothetical protein HZB46_06035 [Solirubrobacterales bacterium]|nr:hypothetical protein [Solirubrobacterales bacterium]
MRRLLLTIIVLLAALAPAPAHAGRLPLEARLTGCTSGPDETARAATFAATMPRIKGAVRMGLRFDLYQRVGFEPWKRVGVEGWGVWHRSEPRRPGFIYTKRVERLRAPAAYRAVVRFRWYGKKARVLRERRRTTLVCSQPDPRANLVAGSLRGRVVDPENADYELVVSNVGYTNAPAFDVVFTIGGRRLAPASAGPLAPDTRDLATVRAPRCQSGETITIEVDPDNRVDESDERNTVIQRPCPF